MRNINLILKINLVLILKKKKKKKASKKKKISKRRLNQCVNLLIVINTCMHRYLELIFLIISNKSDF